VIEERVIEQEEFQEVIEQAKGLIQESGNQVEVTEVIEVLTTEVTEVVQEIVEEIVVGGQVVEEIVEQVTEVVQERVEEVTEVVEVLTTGVTEVVEEIVEEVVVGNQVEVTEVIEVTEVVERSVPSFLQYKEQIVKSVSQDPITLVEEIIIDASPLGELIVTEKVTEKIIETFQVNVVIPEVAETVTTSIIAETTGILGSVLNFVEKGPAKENAKMASSTTPTPEQLAEDRPKTGLNVASKPAEEISQKDENKKREGCNCVIF